MRFFAAIVLLAAVASAQVPVNPRIAVDTTNRTYCRNDWMQQAMHASNELWLTFQANPTNAASYAIGDSSRYYRSATQAGTNRPTFIRTAKASYCWFNGTNQHWALQGTPVSNVVAGGVWLLLTNALVPLAISTVYDSSQLSVLANKGLSFVIQNDSSLGRTNALLIGIGSPTGRSLRIQNDLVRTGWQHYAFTVINGSVRLYTNGALAATYTNADVSDSGAFVTSSLPQLIGCSTGTTAVKHPLGIDDLRFYSTTNVVWSNVYNWTRSKYQ